MVTEDFVSFEIAKLLKEKGFDEPCQFFYFSISKYKQEGVFIGNFHARKNNEINEASCSAPTLQMAMKWLREVHNLHIDVDPSEGNWNPTVLELENWACAVKFGDNIPIQDSYEEACEAAIKYCLKNLI